MKGIAVEDPEEGILNAYSKKACHVFQGPQDRLLIAQSNRFFSFFYIASSNHKNHCYEIQHTDPCNPAFRRIGNILQ
jgi:hypothetical protein